MFSAPSNGERLIIAGDLENGDEYLSEIVDDLPHGHDPTPRPIVRVLRAARYPNQRAITDPDIPMEFPAIEAGTLCRLEVLRKPTDEERALLNMSAEEALGKALNQAMEEARNEEERDILRRHAAGQFGRRRVLVTFLSSDIAYLNKFSGRVKR